MSFYCPASFILKGGKTLNKKNKILQNVLTFIIVSILFIAFYFQNQNRVITPSDISIFLILIFLIGYIWSVRDKSLKNIEHIAYYDELTGLPNLVWLKKHISTTLNSHPNEEFAIIKIDIEDFKAINELYDFEVGNNVLKAFGKTAASVDEKTFVIARCGVDEFMLFSGNNFIAELDSRTTHYEAYFKKVVPEISNHQLYFNYGRYIIPIGENDINDIINKVTIAHRDAKAIRDNRIHDYNDNLKRKLLSKIEITNKMEKALNNGEFYAYLQPKFRLSDDELIGAEALVRWIDKNNKITFPNDFIPVFEANGFIIHLDYFILELVCKTIRDWLDKGYPIIPVSVNFSRVHLSNSNLANNVSDIINKYNIPSNLIEIELTETAILENKDDLDKLLLDFEKKEISISIDDFGAGYSSLGLIKSIKADTLKLDKSFLDNPGDSKRGELVISGIVSLAQSLDMKIVAEGVEEESQIKFLKSINCESAQGYFYAKPMPINEFEDAYLKK